MTTRNDPPTRGSHSACPTDPGSGHSQTRNCSGSVHAVKTSAGGAGSTLRTRTTGGPAPVTGHRAVAVPSGPAFLTGHAGRAGDLATLDNGRTRLRFRQEYAQELADDDYGIYNYNWGYYPDSLRLLVETGKGKPFQVDNSALEMPVITHGH